MITVVELGQQAVWLFDGGVEPFTQSPVTRIM